jgi:acetyl-CoA carboxylase biotin carboxylase subunit
VVGVDLVKEQIRVAEGKPLPFKQEDLKQDGHAIECRIYAEDPYNNFMPNPGRIRHITEPLGLGIRHDGYVFEGYEIPMYYDPMISKLIVWASTREEAIARMRRALLAYKITGVKTSIPFLEKIMLCKPFVEGKYNTHFIEDNMEFLVTPDACELECSDVAIMATFIHYLDQLKDAEPTKPTGTRGNLWKEYGRRHSVLRL